MTRPPAGHGEQGALFDLLPEPAGDAPVHLLMPNMGLVCGRDTLTVLRSRRTLPAQATCADCQAVPDVLKRIHDMQRGRR